MSELFYDKYRVKTARLPFYDYGSNGSYFITIATWQRDHFFGEIEQGEMNFSLLGKHAQECWLQIPEHFQFVKLGAFVIMPNHVHGIITIDRDIETQDFVSLPSQARRGPQSKNVPSIVRGFKIGVTKFARKKLNIDNVWQAGYYDRVIRNDKEYERISNYIRLNPKNWLKDGYN